MPTTAATAPAAVPSTGKDAPAKPGRKLSKKMLIIILVVLAAGGFFGYKKMKPAKPQPPEPGAVVSLDPTTLNLAGNHYLKIALDLRLVLGKASPDDFAKGLAQQLVISEFSNHTVQSLASNKARDQLQKDLAKKIKKAYPDEIYQVYLTQFVTQ